MKREKREKTEPVMRRDITYLAGVEMEEAVEIVRHCFFRDEEMELTERVLRNQQEFGNAYMELIKYWNFERCLAELHANTKKETFYYYGTCAVCNSPQPFIADYRFAEEENGKRKPNWRERMICPNCGCNSRQRFILHKLFADYQPGKKILMYEQESDVLRKASREIEDITGFEYLGEECNENIPEGVCSEDICKLSFADEEFELAVSNDVFEHTTDYKRAFREAFRVLRPGGKLIFTVPFDGNSPLTDIRAEMGENGLVHTAPEWYHASPIPGGSELLVCQIFGWDMLEVLKECGFKDAYGKVYYGLKEGYLGYLPLYFEALK